METYKLLCETARTFFVFCIMLMVFFGACLRGYDAAPVTVKVAPARSGR